MVFQHADENICSVVIISMKHKNTNNNWIETVR
jgi:hypothetical protein